MCSCIPIPMQLNVLDYHRASSLDARRAFLMGRSDPAGGSRLSNLTAFTLAYVHGNTQRRTHTHTHATALARGGWQRLALLSLERDF